MFSKNILLLLVIFQIVEKIQSQTIQEVLDNKQCGYDYSAPLTQQLIEAALRVNCCDIAETDGIVKIDQKLQKGTKVGISKYLEMSTLIELEKTFQLSEQQVVINYGLMGLPQYFLYNQFINKNQFCGNNEVTKMLGNSYETCKLCQGNYISLTDPQQIQLIMKNKEFVQDQQTKLFTLKQSKSLSKLFVQTFQKLWNCNYPEQKIQVTGYFNLQTQQKLLQTNVNGFDFICDNCTIKDCNYCTTDQKKCLKCKSGFTLEENICKGCDDENCELCPKDDNGVQQCLTCKSGTILFLNKCQKDCPPNYTKTAKTCLQCGEGEYVGESSCLQCSQFCKKCTGNTFYECKKCFTGFIMVPEEGCKPIPPNSPCDIDKCKDNEFKSEVYPFKCTQCHATCAQCEGPGPSQCTSCKNPDQYQIIAGYCLEKQEQAIDSIDKKQCPFTCNTCDQDSEELLCTSCKDGIDYYIQVNTLLKCVAECPIGYIEDTTQDKTPIQCILDIQQNDDLQDFKKETEILEKCEDGSFLDDSTGECNQCPERCISCNALNTCEQCNLGFFWDSTLKICSQCHFSCKKCTGESIKECVLCESQTQIYPDENGLCFQDKAQKEYDKYDVEFTYKYSQKNSLWANFQIIPDIMCTKDLFPQKYQAMDSFKACKDSDFPKTTIGQSLQGSVLTIYATIFGHLGAIINQRAVNPLSLGEYVKGNKLMNVLYMQNIQEGCKQFTCESVLNTQITGLETAEKKKISLKIVKILNLFQDCYDDNKDFKLKKEIQAQAELLLENSKKSFSSSLKQFLLLEVCGKKKDTEKYIIQYFLVQKQMENGNVFKVLNTQNMENQQDEEISLEGGKNEHWELYKIKKIKVIQTEEIQGDVNLDDSLAEQYENKTKENDKEDDIENIQDENEDQQQGQKEEDQNNDQNEDQKEEQKQDQNICKCISAKEYILQNENITELTRIVKEDLGASYLFTKSINLNDITPFFKRNKININDYKNSKKALSKKQANNIFNSYLQQIINQVQKYYDLKSIKIPNCISNVLIDIAFSNKKNLLDSPDKQIKMYLQQYDFQKILEVLQESFWCGINTERCSKAKQVIKGCIIESI